jgi:tetratricopeptide (TPR) repeat protein
MIREQLLALREKRALLVVRAGEQRNDVLVIVGRLERATAWYDRAKAIGRKLRANPLWVAAGVALLVAARPRKAVKLFTTAYSLWRGWRNLKSLLERFAPAQPPVPRAY